MHLSRINPPWKEGFSGRIAENFKVAQSSHDQGTGDWVVVAEFPHFGESEQRRSDFEVEITWDDVEAIIAKFGEVGHAKGSQLANAISALG
jgi:hypothetical protein